MASILVAYDSQYGIGRDGQIPWKCPEDMRRFREQTMGNVLIMGRKTAEDIDGELVGRRCIVLTSGADMDYLDGTASIDNSLEHAIAYCRNDHSDKKIFIIGGEQVYREALEKDLVDTVYATKIHGLHGCDRFFPIDLIPKDWRHDIYAPAAPVGYEFHTWRRLD